MRLIDAENLLAEVDCNIELVSVDETMYIPYVDYVDEICHAPTVEAIPIEWIKDTIKLAERVEPNEYSRYLNLLLKDWRIENEKENN